MVFINSEEKILHSPCKKLFYAEHCIVSILICCLTFEQRDFPRFTGKQPFLKLIVQLNLALFFFLKKNISKTGRITKSIISSEFSNFTRMKMGPFPRHIWFFIFFNQDLS